MTRNPLSDGEAFSVALLNSMLNAHANEAVLDGCQASTGSGSFEVDIASGRIQVADSKADVSAQTVTHNTSDSNDRLDLVTVGADGIASITTGSPDTSTGDQPVAPDIPSDEVLLAAVHVRGGSSEILAGDIYDYRAVDGAITPASRQLQTAASIRYGGGSDGWVVPDDTRLVEDPEGLVESGPLNAFDSATDVGSNNIGNESSDAWGITWDGSSYWVVDESTLNVYEYDSDWNHTGTSIDVSGESDDPRGLAWDGSSYWVVEFDDTIYEYDSDWNHTGTAIDVLSEGGTPHGITWDGSSYWITVRNNDDAIEYDSDWNHTGTIIDLSSDIDVPQGLMSVGSSYWVVDSFNDNAVEFSADWNSTGNTIDFSNETLNPSGLTWDGSSFWLTDDLNDSTHAYDGNSLSNLGGHDVVISSGESLVGGAHLATDEQEVVSLASGTNNQTVYLGWQDSAADTVLVGLDSDFTADDPRIPIWEFDTDSSSVTATRDLRTLERTLTPTVVANDPVDVRALSNPERGWEAYHDGSGSNTEGPASYDGSSWTSLVDNSTIS